MSSHENLAARLKTGSKLSACIGHHHHHHLNNNNNHHHHHHLQSQSSMAAASRARAKQRKWRVLVSIGLLLPALAAIIGIVAWAISIEVANSEPSSGAGASRVSPTSLAQRRAERLEQQQLRHEEALQMAANLAAMRRSARAQPDNKSASVNTINSNAPQPPTEATSGQPSPIAAAIVAPAAPQQQQSQQVTTKRRAVPADQSSRQQQQQQQQQPRQTANATKTKSESASQHTQTTSEALSVASSEEEPPTTKPDEPQTMTTTTSESGDVNSEAATTSTPGSEVEATEQDNNEQQQRKLDPMDQPTKLKSRWLNGDKQTKNKSPMQASRESTESVPKTKSVKQILENLRSSNKQTKTSALMSNRYTLVQGGESKASSSSEHEPSSIADTDHHHQDQREKQEREEKFMVAAAKQAVKMMKKSGANLTSRQRPTVVVVSANEQEPSTQQQQQQDDQSTTGEERTSAGGDANSTNDEDDDADLSFEAIASAISTSLSHQSNGNAKPTSDSSLLSPSEAAPTSANQESLDESEQVASDDQQQRHPQPLRPNKARRTPGEHVAEVIDHLVDRRKQQQQQFSDSQRPLSGPQIVVVAPVGSSSLVNSARSLVKSEEPDQAKVAASKAALAQKAAKKASEEPTKKKNEQSKSTKPIGARLMGSLGALQNVPAGKYSERVEVIEDDDSSGLLMKSAANEQDGDQTSADDDQQQQQQDERQPTSSSSDAFAPMGDDFANMHVSSNSGEPRLRSPRHELSESQSFERYAPIQQQHFDHHHHHHQQQQQQQQQPAKLYSAEQLIREAVLKSKSRPHQQPMKQVEANEQQQQQQQTNRNDHQQQSTTTPATISTTTPATIGQSASSTTSTTSEPQAASTSTTENSPAQGPQQSQKKASRQQQEPHQLHTDSQQHADQFGIQSVQVPLFTRQQQQQQLLLQQKPQFIAQLRAQQQSYQPHHSAQPIDMYQPMESQQQVHQVARPAAGFALSHNKQQPDEQQQAQQQQQQQLPVFADQEFNVPAHMAESVISQIQQSPSTVTGMVNGQPTMFHAHAPGQVPSHQHQLNFGAANHRQMMPAPPQMAQQMAVASSNREPHVYMQPHPSTQRQPLIQHWTQQQAAFAADLMARLAANRRHQLEQQLQSRQLMANRNGGASGAEQQAKGEKQEAAASGGKKSILSSVSKALRPRSLVQPMAQKAFDHLFSSFSQQAAAQQAEIESSAAAAEEDEQRASGPAQPSSASVPSSLAAAATGTGSQVAPGGSPTAPTNNQETLQGSASAPIASAALPPAGQLMSLQSAADSSAGRAMRSLPIGASASQAQQVRITDQEVQESYGQMPTYQMAGGDHYGGGGGGGGGYHDYHQPDHDKKSKGITFHFGGGPIGGGTQLITSPMGIFRHLMIPLLPNPRVNLNGKVVFGVVLEKNTAFGSPPKKKHKFWGR